MLRARNSPTNLRRHGFVVLVALLALLPVALASTGFGATSATPLPSANITSTLTLTDPAAEGAEPPICTNTFAPLDTDDCADVTFSAANPKTLRLGSLAGTDVQAGSLRWLVTTTHPTGYTVRMSNPGPAPLLRSSAASIADMQSSPSVPAGAVDDSTHFGVALGDPGADNEAAVDFIGSPWVTAGGQQGELFLGIPQGGIVVAARGTAQSNDPFTATFAVASVAGQQPATGSYSGTVRIAASVV
ncbi:MAG: hypothetical protein JWM90_1704 [Thermoleophilia bacterium]|nr:hypothetical protein [Thermoleophilia bacterium]